MKSNWRRRIRWFVGISLGMILLAAALGWRFWATRHLAQWQMLDQVIQIESAGSERSSLQLLGWNLAILGRDDEVRRLDFHPQFDMPPVNVDRQQLRLNIVPWRDGIQQIAEQHRIVMLMEDHFVSKHREMIGATLPMFRDAGFTHYAVEAIGESGEALQSRGYPVVRTGYYTSDPQFGNALRKALELKYQVLGYDFRPFTHEMREEFAASELAKLIQEDPKTKLLVHAGHAHVLKHETDLGQRWLASLLWEKTGIEPFTVWQWSSMHDGHEHRVVAEAMAELGEFDEPMLLMPPPSTESGLRNVPRVDAILIHPPDPSFAPSDRTVLFPEAMQRISGQWLTQQWPVVIAAYKRGEPSTAIALDQVMLRNGESEFVLWVLPSTECDIVVFNPTGIVETRTESDGGRVMLQASEPPNDL